MYSKVQNSNSALTEGKNIDTIKAGIKTLYGGKGNRKYVGISNTILNDARITPDSMRKVPYVAGDNIITNSFGGNVIILPIGPTGPDSGFEIIYQKVPGSVCAKLVSAVAPGFDLIRISPGFVQVKSFSSNSVDIAQLATMCAGDNGDLEIRFGTL